MRSRGLIVPGLVLPVILALLILRPDVTRSAEPREPSAGDAVAKQLVQVSRQLEDLKQGMAQVLAEQEDLKTRLREMTGALEHLAGTGAAKPQKPRVERLPKPLPELQPLPDE